MIRWSILGAVALLSVACAYQNPVQPTPAPISAAAPATLTLGTVSEPGRAMITAHVLNAQGVPLPAVEVAFFATGGTLSSQSVMTTGGGAATVTLSGSNLTASVSAVVGPLTASTMVVTSGGTAPAPAPLPIVFLNVSASAVVGVPLAFGVSSAVSGTTWLWSFGDGTNATTSAFSTTHTYTTAGIYTASVSSATTSAASAQIVVAPAPTPAPPAARMTLTVTCVAAPHGSTTNCNVGAVAADGSIVTGRLSSAIWDWGDGGADISSFIQVANHAYRQAGTYTVSVSAIADGNTASTSTNVVIQ